MNKIAAILIATVILVSAGLVMLNDGATMESFAGQDQALSSLLK